MPPDNDASTLAVLERRDKVWLESRTQERGEEGAIREAGGQWIRFTTPLQSAAVQPKTERGVNTELAGLAEKSLEKL